MITLPGRQLAFLIVLAIICWCSTSNGQGAAGALNSAGKSRNQSSDEQQIDEKSWAEDNPFDDRIENEDPGISGEGGVAPNKSKDRSGEEPDSSKRGNGQSDKPTATSTKNNGKASLDGPAIDSRVRRLQDKIDRLQRIRDSKQVLNQMDSIEKAKEVADRYRKLTEKEIQRAAVKNEAWRAPLVKSLRDQMRAADELIQEIEADRPLPGSVAEKVAINRLNHALLDVYLAALRLRLDELKWMREAELPTFQIEARSNMISLDFISWENNPALQELVADRKGIIQSIKEVQERMSALNSGAVAMLATLQINLKIRVWKMEDRFYEVVLIPANSPVPVIPDSMQKKEMLRMEATRTALDLGLLTLPLTADDIATLRENGELEIDLADSRPIQSLEHWVLTDSNNAKIVLSRRKNDSNGTSDSDVDKPLGTAPENDDASKGPDDNDADTRSEGDTSDDKDSANSSDTSSDPDESTSPDRSTDNDGAEGPGNESDGKEGELDNDDKDKNDEDESSEDGSTVGFDDRQGGGSPDDKPAKDRPNDVLAPDLDSDPNGEASSSNYDPRKNNNRNDGTGAGASNSVEGNWLSIDGVKRMPPQQVQGFWKDAQSGVVEWFEVLDDRLVVRSTDNLLSMGIDVYRRKDSDRYFGRAYTVPRSGNCTHVGFWQPAALRVSLGRASGQWKGKKVDKETCQLGELPDGGDFEFERVLVTSFHPLANGKLLHVTASPSVGGQRSQLKATAKISVRQSDVPGSVVKVYLEKQRLERNTRDNTFDFITTRSGRHTLQVEVLTSEGKLLHQEDVRIDIPAISGIGN